jgi:magnesium transporter
MIVTHQFTELKWVDLVDATDDELTQTAQQYALGANTFVEAHRRAARPTLQRFEDHVYIVAFSGRLAEIDMYLGPDWLITVRRHDPDGQEWDPQTARERFLRGNGTAGNSGNLLLTILDELVDGYFEATDALEDQLEGLEEQIFGESISPPQTVQQDLFQVRRQLLQIRRVVMPLRDVLAMLSRQEVPWVHGTTLAQCHATYDKLLRAVDVVDEQRELVGNAVDAHLAVMSNQMNLVMKQLTAWGSIVFGATLIAGIYGMNFTHMPELDWRFGYPLALGSMGVLSLILFRVFKRRSWL